jgi:hypothetical protein
MCAKQHIFLTRGGIILVPSSFACDLMRFANIFCGYIISGISGSLFHRIEDSKQSRNGNEPGETHIFEV